MNPFEGVAAEDGFVDKTPKRAYKAIQGRGGRFIDNILDMSEGVRAEDITPEVSKSYIPGKGWIPATQAGKKALRGAKHAHQGSRGVSDSDKSFRTSLNRQHDQVTALSDNKGSMRVGRGTSATVRETPNTGGAEAYAYMHGRTRNMVVKPGADKRVVAHEAAHLSPRKRTPYRMAQIQRDPGKAMREEARADMAGGFKYRDPAAKRPQGFYSGYASAAAKPGEAGKQRQHGRALDARSSFAARVLGEQPLGSRGKMFNQRSLGGYRQVQDNIDSSRGVNYKRSTRSMNNQARAESAVRTYGKPAAVGAVVANEAYRDRKVKKAFAMPKMKLPKPPQPPKPQGAPKMSLNPIARVPKTTTPSPMRPRIKESGISKASERGELVARQFPRDKQLRVTRVRKSGPDQADVHVPGAGLAGKRRRRPKYPSMIRPC